MPEIKGKLIMATVAEDASGIHLRVATDDNKLEITFLPVNETMGDISLVLKEGMDAEKELQKVCDLMNGYEKNKDGSLSPIVGFMQKKITLMTQ